jgi:ubiquitin carboxyl-terminal hydrolase L3
MRVAPTDRAKYLLESPDLDSIYSKAALEGSSEPPPTDIDVEYHYICLVNYFDYLFELDGDRNGPICRAHLEKDEDVLSRKGRNILKMYIDSCPEGNFSLLALMKST